MKDHKTNSFVQFQPKNYIKGRNQHIKFPRDAFHESNILCLNCDNVILKRFEDYLKLTFHDTVKNVARPIVSGNYINEDKKRFCVIENLDYNLYKLGFLSILWRASVSKLDVFKEVSLGIHSDKIRMMLLNSDAMKDDDYPFLTSFINMSDFHYKIIIPVNKFKFLGYTNYRFIINGLDIMFMIGSKNISIDSRIKEFVPNESGVLKVYIHEKNYSTKLLNELFNKKPKR